MRYPDSLQNNLFSSKYHIEKHGFELLTNDGFKGKRILEVACVPVFIQNGWLTIIQTVR